MYPRGRGKGTPLGGNSTDQDGPTLNESPPTNNTYGNSSAASSPSLQVQQQPRPRRFPHQMPYSMSGNVTVNLSGSRGEAPLYPNQSSHSMLPPPPLPPSAQPGGYYDGENGTGGCPFPYYGGGNAGVGHGYVQRFGAPAYDQLPPPTPPGGYDGEGVSYHDNALSSPTSPPPFSAASNAVNNYPLFSHHNHTSSPNNAMGMQVGMNGIMNAGGPKANGDYRPPPVYGDLPLGGPVGAPHNATNSASNSGNSSFTRVAPSNSGPGTSSGSARLQPYVGGGSGGPPGAPNAATAPSFSGRYYEGLTQQVPRSPASTTIGATPTTTAAAARLPRGPLGLKVTVGTNATVVSNPVAVSPLPSSPLQREGAGSSNGVGGEKNAARATQEKATTPTNNAVEGGSNSTASPALRVTTTGDDEGEASTTTLKPTVEQAEARYQYLYEEFRKLSRVRAKLVEDGERLKRELAASMEEAHYYRQKTLTAAEEREAIVHDYSADIHYLLRLVDALASDVVAAHKRTAKREVNNQKAAVPAKPDNLPSTPQLAIDVAASRLAAIDAIHTASPTASAMPDGSTTLPPEIPWLAEYLGLHHGVWMTGRSTATSEVVTGEDGYLSVRKANERSNSTSTTTAMTPAQKQGVLLRDEMRDVHRSAHAVMNSYMTSLDYGSAPVSTLRGGAHHQTGHSSIRHNGADRFSQRQFKSEYRGLHLYVDVPRFHAQGGSDMPSVVEQPLGQANDGVSSMNSSLSQSYAPRERSRETSGAQ